MKLKILSKIKFKSKLRYYRLNLSKRIQVEDYRKLNNLSNEPQLESIANDIRRQSAVELIELAVNKRILSDFDKDDLNLEVEKLIALSDEEFIKYRDELLNSTPGDGDLIESDKEPDVESDVKPNDAEIELRKLRNKGGASFGGSLNFESTGGESRDIKEFVTPILGEVIDSSELELDFTTLEDNLDNSTLSDRGSLVKKTANFDNSIFANITGPKVPLQIKSTPPISLVEQLNGLDWRL